MKCNCGHDLIWDNLWCVRCGKNMDRLLLKKALARIEVLNQIENYREKKNKKCLTLDEKLSILRTEVQK
jgi:hypothetical protein